ncbi:hypothetical protein DET65_3876 [Sunxiuqinia elliptica]|uniref:Uncharacterized protein n=1 Tax=Sunxiuqinia elliptica TaxID=655355 RepID=A0A4R6GVX8_9BACT|nr:hypothetical protein DET52_10712 [Sunxiuqinia elliptica]TDO56326.1 hypothetical protein DET65_3876 [Sunxiuqinia elliptica]
MTLNCKIIKHEHIQQYMVGRVEKYEQISKLCTILTRKQ